MLPIDNDIREQILKQDGNVVISASAGTGKTYTTVLRITRDANVNTGYMTFAAITFTRKAAKEIANRLGPKKVDGFVGTNDNFVLLEVIQPFLYDAFGNDYKIVIKPDYNTANAVRTNREGLEKIKDSGYMCKLIDKRQNFPFRLALAVLKKSHSARRYLKSKYYRFYIDEYQDCDVDMHNFFMYLSDELAIPLFIVGDEKQSIYSWRGAYCKGFVDLYEKPGFTRFELRHNFRSCIAIQNYSNIFMPSVRSYYKTVKVADEVSIYKYNNIEEACNFIFSWISKVDKCAMLNFKRDVARVWSSSLNQYGLNFIYVPEPQIENSDMESEHIWVARGIASYCLKNRYSEYDFRDEIPVPESIKISTLKTKLETILRMSDEAEMFKEACIDLYKFLGFLDKTEKMMLEVNVVFNVISDDQNIYFYNQERYLFTSGTIHSSKGLEFNQVIINAGDYDLSKDDMKFLHYVAVTRPEKKLLILANGDTIFNRYMEYIDEAVTETQNLGFDISTENVIKIIESE